MPHDAHIQDFLDRSSAGGRGTKGAGGDGMGSGEQCLDLRAGTDLHDELRAAMLGDAVGHHHMESAHADGLPWG